MRIFGHEIKFMKTYEQLRQMILREKSDGGALRTQPRAQIDAYRSWAYSCVSLISDRISTLPYSFYNKDTNQKLDTKNKNFRTFTKPFRNPNDLMTFRFMKQFLMIQLDLCGMSVIYPVKNVLNQVWELWPLNMNDFVKVTVSDNLINPTVKYVFRSGSGWIDFDISEICLFNYPNPKNMYEPMSPIQAQAYATDIDAYIEVYERSFFKNSARIDFALVTDIPVNQAKADEIKARWKEKYGFGQFHDIAVLDSGLKPVPLNMANKDFEFMALAGWSKAKTLAAYRVPESKLGSAASNRAGSVQSDISFNRESIQPRLSIIDEEFSAVVCSSFDERLELRHENPIPRDRQLEVAESKAYLGGFPTMTPDEFREKYHNLPPLPDGLGKRMYVPNKFIPIDKIDEVTQGLMNPTNDPSSDGNTGGDGRPGPDGSDDRDDNPTDGRSTPSFTMKDLSAFEDRIRPVWVKSLSDLLIKIGSEDIGKKIQEDILNYMQDTVEGVAEKFSIDSTKVKSLVGDDAWLSQYAKDASSKLEETILSKNHEGISWNEFVVKQMELNVRMVKLVNTTIRACVNYAKYLVLRSQEKPLVWLINRNECGHKGRIENKCVTKHFKLGIQLVRFPGEKFNLKCDCTLSTD